MPLGFGKEVGGAVVPLPRAWGCREGCVQSALDLLLARGVDFLKLLSLTVRQAPSCNKFLAYLKVVDTPCVREVCASTAGCCLWGFLLLRCCGSMKSKSWCLCAASQPCPRGSLSCLTCPSVTHTPELLRRRDSNLWAAFL